MSVSEPTTEKTGSDSVSWPGLSSDVLVCSKLRFCFCGIGTPLLGCSCSRLMVRRLGRCTYWDNTRLGKALSSGRSRQRGLELGRLGRISGFCLVLLACIIWVLMWRIGGISLVKTSTTSASTNCLCVSIIVPSSSEEEEVLSSGGSRGFFLLVYISNLYWVQTQQQLPQILLHQWIGHMSPQFHPFLCRSWCRWLGLDSVSLLLRPDLVKWRLRLRNCQQQCSWINRAKVIGVALIFLVSLSIFS